MSYVEAEKPTCKFHESVRRGLRSAMYHLGLCRSEENREEFEQTLVRLGMSKEEAEAYYCIVRSSKPVPLDSLDTYSSNTEFAQAFGVLVNYGLALPRCWLLYRLCELVAPHAFQYKIAGTTHMGGSKSRKGSSWNPNDLARDRRIVIIVKGPRDPETDNPIPVYKMFS